MGQLGDDVHDQGSLGMPSTSGPLSHPSPAVGNICLGSPSQHDASKIDDIH